MWGFIPQKTSTFLLFSPNSLCLTLMLALVHQQPLNAGHLENAAVSFFSLPPGGAKLEKSVSSLAALPTTTRGCEGMNRVPRCVL